MATAELVAGSVAVINGIRKNGMVDLDKVEHHFQARCREVARIPCDEVLQAGAESALTDLRPSTRMAYLELAAKVAKGFADPGARAASSGLAPATATIHNDKHS
jgi:putative peptide zinc metalloprotease protein